MAIISRLAFLVSVAAAAVSCASTGAQDPKEVKAPPQITHDMPLDDAVRAGIEFGGDTARSVRKLITKRKEWPKAEKLLADSIGDNVTKYESPQLVNAVMLYLAGPVKPSAELFQKLTESGRPLARQLAWQMAASIPGKTMRQAIEREMNRALMDGDDSDILIPQMAIAVQSNRMTSAYTIVRQGLMSVGHEDFAAAMSTLDPSRASLDFIDYLATCPPEELRQLSVSSVNVYAATVALNHLVKMPPPSGHPRLEAVFYYAISRNPGLSDLGAQLIDTLATQDQRGLAIMLSRLPTWAQVAYIETARRNMTPTRRVFLSELKMVSPQAEVAEELGEIQL